MRKFHRTKGRRKLFMTSIAANLVMQGKIETTVARAKEVRPLVERFITIGKGQNVASLRMLRSKLPKAPAEKVFYDLAPRYAARHGGYLRITKQAKARKRDGAETATIAFVS